MRALWGALLVLLLVIGVDGLLARQEYWPQPAEKPLAAALLLARITGGALLTLGGAWFFPRLSGAAVFWPSVSALLLFGVIAFAGGYQATGQWLRGAAGGVVLVAAAAVIAAALVFGRRRQQITALARTTFSETVRENVLLVLAVVSFLPGLVALFFGKADGTTEGKIRSMTDWSLVATAFFGTAMAVVISSRSLPREIETRNIYSLMSKPVTPSQVLLGRILGLLGVCAVYLLAMGLFINLIVYSFTFWQGAGEEIHQGVLHARQPVPARWVSDDSEVQKRLRERSEVGLRQGDGLELVVAVPKNSRRPYYLRLLGDKSALSVGSSFQVRLEIEPEGEKDGPRQTILAKLLVRRPQEVRINDEVVRPGEKLRVRLTVPAGQMESERLFGIVLFKKEAEPSASPLSAGVNLVFPGDPFWLSVFKHLALVFLQLATIVVVTVSWSGVVSFPVAAAVGLMVGLGGHLSGFALEALEAERRAELWRAEREGEEAPAAGFWSHLAEFLCTVPPDFAPYSGAFELRRSLPIPWARLASAVILLLVWRSLYLGFIGWYGFCRREIGA